MYEDLVAFIKIRRTESDVPAYVTRFRLLQTRAESHTQHMLSSAGTPSTTSSTGHTPQPFPSPFVSALLIEGAALSTTDRKLVLASVKGDLSDTDTIAHTLKRMFPREQAIPSSILLAENKRAPIKTSSESESSTDGEGLQNAYLAYKRAKLKWKPKIAMATQLTKRRVPNCGALGVGHTTIWSLGAPAAISTT